MEPNWDAIGAIGEIVGAIAVVGSLVYLATQIRAQNRESRISSVHEISSAIRNAMSLLGSDGDTAEIVVKGINDFDDMSDAERLRYIILNMIVLRVYEEAYYQVGQNRLDDYIWEGMKSQLTDFLGTDGAQKVWQLRGHQFGNEFRDFIDELEPTKYAL